MQPLSLSDNYGRSSLKEILNALKLPTDTRELFKTAFSTSREQENDEQRMLKEIRGSIIESVSVSRTVLHGARKSRILVLHVNRMKSLLQKPKSKEGDEKGRSYEILEDLLKLSLASSANEAEMVFPLLEVNLLIKFLGGGMI